MSSGVEAPDDLKHFPQSTGEDQEVAERSGTESSILYLLQEATKLATPLNQCSSMATEQVHSKGDIALSTPSLKQKTLSLLSDVQTSSPWEVMSLINLQCEKLLHCEQTPGEDGDFYTCISNTTDDLECKDVVDCSSFALAAPAEFCTCEPRSTEASRQITADYDANFDVCSSVPNIDSSISNQTANEHNGGAQLSAVEDLAELISKNTADVFSNVGIMSDESSAFCLVVETSLVPLVVVEKDMDTCLMDSQTPLEFSFHTQQGETSCDTSISEAPRSPSSEISSVDFTSSLVDDKDGNSSMCFSFSACENPELQSTPQSHQQGSALIFRTDLNNNLEENKDDSLQEPEIDQVSPLAQRSGENRRRTPRKQAHPERSPDLQNPELQGVTFSMHTELDRSTDQCRLLITSNYSEVCRRSRRIRSSRSRSLQSTQRTSSSEEESDPASLSKKICASCCTRKTPLWRDAEDGTPLCNACGIRYKKYRVRCLQCWNIPKKEANSNSKCLKCGDLLQLAAQNKRAGW